MQVRKENRISIAFAVEGSSAIDRGDLDNLTAFVAVADQRSFRAAASRLDVTPSALSHSMRQLEQRLGVRLLHRTTRSMSLTDAGLRLLERLRPAISQIAGALEDLNRERQRPLGRLRIYAVGVAAAAGVGVGVGRVRVARPGWPRGGGGGRRSHRVGGEGLRWRTGGGGGGGGGRGSRAGDGTDGGGGGYPAHKRRGGAIHRSPSTT